MKPLLTEWRSVSELLQLTKIGEKYIRLYLGGLELGGVANVRTIRYKRQLTRQWRLRVEGEDEKERCGRARCCD